MTKRYASLKVIPCYLWPITILVSGVKVESLGRYKHLYFCFTINNTVNLNEIEHIWKHKLYIWLFSHMCFLSFDIFEKTNWYLVQRNLWYFETELTVRTWHFMAQQPQLSEPEHSSDIGSECDSIWSVCNSKYGQMCCDANTDYNGPVTGRPMLWEISSHQSDCVTLIILNPSIN